MAIQQRSRRVFLQELTTVAAAAACFGPAVVARARKQPDAGCLRLGGPVFSPPEDPAELARAHRNLGYRAAYCPKVGLRETDRLRAISAAFAKEDVVIAEVGRWVNLLDADPESRKKNFDAVVEGLALAEEVGALCCVDIVGSFNPKSWFGPDPKNLSRECFDAAMENARRIIDAVKPRRAKFCYEMMGWTVPDSPEMCLKLIKAVDRREFGAHLDPCNLVNSPAKFYRNGDLIDECFQALGKHIISCHAKDLAWDIEMNVHFREVLPGQGQLDYAAYLRGLAKLPQKPPLMMEHLSKPEDYTAARDHIVKQATQLGLRFEPSPVS